MITRFGMAPRASGLSIEGFRHHWRTSHADAAGQIPGALRYHQNHSLLEHGMYLLGYPGFDACSELDFDSVEAMEDGFASETYATVVRDDEDAFVDKSRFSLVVTKVDVTQGGPHGAVKLLEFHRTHPAGSDRELIATLTGSAPGLSELCTRQAVYSPVPHNGPPQAFDAVHIMWVADRFALRSLLASNERQEAQLELAGVASGSASLAAEIVEVI